MLCFEKKKKKRKVLLTDVTASSRRKNYKNIIVFSYFTERKTAQCSSVVLKRIPVLLHRIEIDLDEDSSREDSLYSSSV